MRNNRKFSHCFIHVFVTDEFFLVSIVSLNMTGEMQLQRTTLNIPMAFSFNHLYFNCLYFNGFYISTADYFNVHIFQISDERGKLAS
jgi:hypothetical protein